MDRLDFIKCTSLAAIAPSLFLNSCNSDNGFPIVDTHIHLWELEMLKLQWVKGRLDKDFLIPDYLKAVGEHNVVKGIYEEVGAPPEKREIEAEWALGLCKDPSNPIVAAVIAKSPFDENFEEYMSKLAEDPDLKGIRYFFSEANEITKQVVVDSMRLLGKMGLVFDLGIPSQWLPEAIELADACPDTLFVLNHCGKADPVAFFPNGVERPREPDHDRDEWIRDMKSIAERPNVICKISGIVSRVRDYPLTAELLAPVINHCLDEFGTEKVVFAGDWPVVLRGMELFQWITILKEVVADRPADEQSKLFHDNAVRLYDI